MAFTVSSGSPEAPFSAPAHEQIELRFEIIENTETGTLIGVIRAPDSVKQPTQPPYLIVPIPGEPSSLSSLSSSSNNASVYHSAHYYLPQSKTRGVESDLSIDEANGEIRNKVILDREQRSYYSFIAIPISGVNIRVIITVLDANDNAPHFPVSFIALEFPENSKPREVKRTLPPAKDFDL
ncbi:protein dachsous-like protein, partial [Dinothrombium tinctorium]